MIAGARWRRGAASLLVALVCSACAGGQRVEVREARAFEALRGGTGALYATIVNPTDSAERLDSVTSAASPHITAHDTREENGMVAMVPMDRPTIPPHDSLVFTPGAAHLMLEDLPHDLKVGDTLSVTFWLQRA
ncbi:MAG TPA: copper chaperone PCu(A)C, partial [Gemmatimonadales bacterium]|nr:copper chaperone PCu(A)C [Gemmatimonadales bacterium]